MDAKRREEGYQAPPWRSGETKTGGAAEAGGGGGQGMQSGRQIPLRILQSTHTPGQLICCPWTSASPPVE